MRSEMLLGKGSRRRTTTPRPSAPIISIALLKRFDSALPVSLYVLGGLLITIVSVWLAPETARIDLHEQPADGRRIVQDPGRLRPT